MRIKILIFPACLVFSFIILTMYAKPEFSASNQAKSDIKIKENTLSEIKQRNERIGSLIKDLDLNSDKEKLVVSYLPKTKEEELVMNSVFQSAVSSSLYLSSFNVDYQKRPFSISPQFQSLQPGGDAPLLPGSMPGSPQVNTSTDIDVMSAKFNLVGTYENIKSFLNQIYAMEKENAISYIRIYKVTMTENQSGGTNVNNLNVEILAYFDNIPALKLKSGAIHPVFSKSNYDFSVLSDLETLFNKKLPNLDTGSVGKANPFLP